MADLSPVSPGEPFRLLDADVCNVLFAMAREWQSKRMGRTGNGTSSGTQGDPISVIMQNRSGSALDQYAIVGISDALVPYADSATEFKRRPQFRATAPTATGPFAVLQQPIANYVSDSTPNTIGRAIISGCAVCKLNVTSSGDTYASPTTSTTELTTGTSGSARILAKESGTGSGKWGVVLINNVTPEVSDWKQLVYNTNYDITTNEAWESIFSSFGWLGTRTLPSTGLWKVEAHATAYAQTQVTSGGSVTQGIMWGRLLPMAGVSELVAPATDDGAYALIADASATSGSPNYSTGSAAFTMIIDVTDTTDDAFDFEVIRYSADWVYSKILGSWVLSDSVAHANLTYFVCTKL